MSSNVLFCVLSRQGTRKRVHRYHNASLVLLVLVIVEMRSTTPVSLDTVFSQFWQTSSVALAALAPFFNAPQQGGAA